ncbi:MAG TPA: amidohydrolase family protein [Chloroflexota bacterium]|nr:amidohydrolase family protein [Chloroflexota bacterium]
MVLTSTPEAASEARPRQYEIVDCDIHNYLPSPKVLGRYLPERWRVHHESIGPRSPGGRFAPQAYPSAARLDAWPASGLPPGSDRDLLIAQLLDRYEMSYGILNPLFTGALSQTIEEYGAAYCRAVNDWQIADWLEHDARFRGTIQIPLEYAEGSVREIERLGAHPGFVQIGLTSRTAEPLGRRKYWPIYEAAARFDLPLGMHFGTWGRNPGTGAGHPSYYVEMHTGQTESFAEIVTSLVCEGVFEEFPTLKFVLIEGGFAWLAPLIWRLDRAYGLLKREVPHLKRLPSEYIREHFWFTTQPIEEPTRPRDFDQLLADLQMDDKIMFATDYPHWDFDSPEEAIPAHLPLDLRRKIYGENAKKVYKLGVGG